MLQNEYDLETAASSAHDDIKVNFDIDHGFDLGDSQFWVSTIKLYEMRAPLDPELPMQPTLLGQSAFYNYPDSGSSWYFDASLASQITQSGKYYIEVTAAYPYNAERSA